MTKISRRNRYFLSLISGILMVLAFPYTGSVTLLVFLAWVPLLLVDYSVSVSNKNSFSIYLHAFITFFIYNLGTTWWIWNASKGGASLAIILNALIMALVFYLFHILKNKFDNVGGYFLLLIFWVTFEYTHYYWELSWPWLTLGNVFSITPSIVQWYSITGVLGGSFWVLLVNVCVFFIFLNKIEFHQSFKNQNRLILLTGSILLVPIIVSLIVYYGYVETKNTSEVIAIQPNVDPKTEKFNTNLKSQLDKIFYQADKNVTKNTKFIIAPETAISATFYEEDLNQLQFFQYLIQRKKKWKRAAFLTGASTLRFFKNKNSYASRKIDGVPGYYESYNTSLLIDEHNHSTFVHKSKLVLGVEKLPFSSIFPWIEKLAINLDGASGSLGIEKEPRVLKAKSHIFAPSICYESIYGDYVSEQVRKGAQLIFVITNDGWWGNTPGYKQHASFSRLRAIENRRSIARSANTGITCFINQRGDVVKQTKWWEETSIRGMLNNNSDITFFTNYGSVIGEISMYSLCFFFLLGIYKSRKNNLLIR